MSILQALLITAMSVAVGWAEAWFSFPMLYMPLVVGPLTGLIMGDVVTGVLCGAACQIIFFAIVGLGNSSPPDSKLGTIIGTALAISIGQGAEICVIIAIFGSLIGQFFFYLGTVIRGKSVEKANRLIEAGSSKRIALLHFTQSLIPTLPGAAATFVVLLLGVFASGYGITVPEWIIHGISMFIALMGAMSIATLMKSFFTKATAVFYFIGFSLAAFGDVPMLAVLLVGLIVIYFVYLIKIKIESNEASNAVVESNSGEEDLFDD